MIRAGLDLFRG